MTFRFEVPKNRAEADRSNHITSILLADGYCCDKSVISHREEEFTVWDGLVVREGEALLLAGVHSIDVAASGETGETGGTNYH